LGVVSPDALLLDFAFALAPFEPTFPTVLLLYVAFLVGLPFVFFFFFASLSDSKAFSRAIFLSLAFL